MMIVTSEMSHQIQEFYLEMKSYINTDRKLELIETLASSLPRMAKLILLQNADSHRTTGLTTS
eukprot:scaffold52633_cov64-Cyclotella_meneghiniana.AAC.1